MVQSADAAPVPPAKDVARALAHYMTDNPLLLALTLAVVTVRSAVLDFANFTRISGHLIVRSDGLKAAAVPLSCPPAYPRQIPILL